MFVDEQIGSSWSIFGVAESCPLGGRKLKPVVPGNHFWFSGVVGRPDTVIYRGREENMP